MALRSTCSRLRVGCVITTHDYRKVLAVGYNGNAAGLSNCCDSSEPGSCGCLHAEENAVINCDSPRYIPKVVFCTYLPCKLCAKRLINMGNVVKVYYLNDYRSKESLFLFKTANIKAIKLEERKTK